MGRYGDLWRLYMLWWTESVKGEGGRVSREAACTALSPPLPQAPRIVLKRLL